MSESSLSSLGLMKINTEPCNNLVSEENITELVKVCTASPTNNEAFIYAARLSSSYISFLTMQDFLYRKRLESNIEIVLRTPVTLLSVSYTHLTLPTKRIV